ncbi:MAG: hypothetical protein SF182_04080 [Deltaproteobacteria bacterium]|nr:hypothetical protein [Deltaproteobacteria bacterium]
MAAVKKKRKTAGRGSVGTEIFEQIEKLMASDKIGRTEAFRRLADKSGRQLGTVAANYYRVARQRGAKLAPRRRRAGGGKAASGGNAALLRAVAALEDVSAVFRKLEAEILQLRKENERFAAVRRLIGT